MRWIFLIAGGLSLTVGFNAWCDPAGPDAAPGGFASYRAIYDVKAFSLLLGQPESDSPVLEIAENLGNILPCYFANYYRARRDEPSFAPRIWREFSPGGRARVTVYVANLRDEIKQGIFERIHLVVSIAPSDVPENWELVWQMSSMGVPGDYKFFSFGGDPQFDEYDNGDVLITNSESGNVRLHDYGTMHMACLGSFVLSGRLVGACARENGSSSLRFFGHAERASQCAVVRSFLADFRNSQ
tara:strand:- start:2152 stop:2877 length:726 start_codon:yes stop_codon:yes gene_type:complete